MAKRTRYTVITNWEVTNADGEVFQGNCQSDVFKSQIETTLKGQIEWLNISKKGKNPTVISQTVVEVA